jgi:spermidine synthase
MMRTYSGEFTTIGKDVGKLDASNSFGAFFGTLAAGFLLIPIMGIQNSIIITASINIILAIIILSTKKYLKPKHLAIIIVIAIPFIMLYPSYDVESLSFGIYQHVEPDLNQKEIESFFKIQEILFHKESLYQSVTVSSNPSGQVLTLNGKIQCSLNPTIVKGLIVLGFIPYNMYEHNYGTPQTALNVGLGCGITSKALSEHLETTTIEIDSVVVEANEKFFAKIDHRLIVDDARNWLLRNDEKFDIIVTEPSDPYQNNGLLFTKEYFSLLNSRLTENGLVSQWVPVWELPDKNFMVFYNTFHSVFPYVYVYYMEPDNLSELIFIGSQKPIEIPNNDLYLFNHEDLIEVETELNTDDKPILEFATALNLYVPSSELTVDIPVKDGVL